jgi:AdoMet-dependent rRNA methyltransferase SPB1
MCAKKTKKGKDRLDKYYHMAKEQGYRSRAAFKLIQLNKKYNFLTNAQVVVDLCAAPGGWLQVARKYMPLAGVLYGVDLASIKKIPNVMTLEGDITSKKTLKRIQTDLNHAKVDVVLHDGAPNVGSNWLKDAFSQSELVLHSLRMACALLKPNGVFVTKVFRSKDYHSLLWVLNQLFNKVESTKPKASRNASAEIYCVCEGFKAPKEIDDKLFDATFVFEDTPTEKKQLKLSHKDLAKIQKKPNKDGYEDGNYILYKTYPVSEFITTEHPINVCVEYNALEWDDKAQIYLNHPLTTEEIKIYCKDLKVLGRLDFKDLLRWRSKMQQYREELEQKAQDEMNDEEAGEENEEMEDEDSAVENKKQQASIPEDEEEVKKELAYLKSRVEKVKKNLMKRKKLKEAKRMPTPFDMTEEKDDIMDNIPESAYFSLSSITSREHLEKALNSGIANAAYDASDSEDYDSDISVNSDIIDLEGYDLDDEEVIDQLLEKQLDAMYDKYTKERAKKQILAEKRQQIREQERKELAKALQKEKEESGQLSLEDIQKHQNPLLVNLDGEVSTSKKVGQWFSQNIFDVLQEEEDEDKDGEEEDEDVPSSKRRKTSESSSDDESESDEEAINTNQPSIKANKDGFETVPQELLDPEVHATTLAIAKKLLRKKARRDFIDDAFNRYAFNDAEQAPSWFAEDEMKHNKPIPPVTKEEVEKERQRFKEINAMPIRAVLEARFRKKRKQMQKMKAAKDKAEEIANSTELTAHEKAKELQKIYKLAKDGKPKVITTFAKKFKNAAKVPKYINGAKVQVLDKRMKKDKRAEKKNESKKRKRK